MRRASLIALLASPFLISACSTVEYNAATGPKMAVSQDRTIFYRHMHLRKGIVVKVLKKEFLYSLVELPNGQRGYVANDFLVDAPVVAEKPTGAVGVQPVRKVARVRKSTSLSPSSSAAKPSDTLPLPSFRY
ncbi:MAG: hypothetical protein WAL87_10090 [Chthoniobacterales bacterium]